MTSQVLLKVPEYRRWRDDARVAHARVLGYGLTHQASASRDLPHRDPGDRGLHARLREKAARTYTIPGTRRPRIAAETLRDCLQAWRKGGFEALRPRGRSDSGQPRAIPAEAADVLCSIKDEHPAFTVEMVIAAARERGVAPTVSLAQSTVPRLLSRRGLMRKGDDEPTTKDRPKITRLPQATRQCRLRYPHLPGQRLALTTLGPASGAPSAP